MDSMDNFGERLEALEQQRKVMRAHTRIVARRLRWAGRRGSPWGVRMSVLVSALWALALWHPAQAAVFNIPVGDVAALIATITTANGNGENNIINLEAGTYTLTVVDNNTMGSNGLPSITSHLTINGAGADRTIITRDASASAFRIVHVAATGVLVLHGLTVTGGDNSAPLVVNAGGLLNVGVLTVTNSTISGNSGGGLANAGELTVTNSTISGNSAFFGIGGLTNAGGLILTNSAISDNFGVHGGIGNLGTVILLNSTVSGNIGRSDGCGGIFNSGTLILTNSTISNNQKFAAFAGICNATNGTVEMTHTIVAGNQATDIFGNTLFQDCTNACVVCGTGGLFTSLGHNLVGVETGCPSDGPGDLTADPAAVFTTVLGPLQDNGGPTQTHALLPGSPAIDAGELVCRDAEGQPLTTDQRGFPRPQGPACDIGAVEFQEGVEPVVIDIRPGRFPNRIHPTSLGTVRVAILIHAAAIFASFFAFRGLSINERTFCFIVWK